MDRMKDQVAIITGVRGIGLAIAKRYAQEGAKLFLTDIDESVLQEAKDELAALGGEVETYACDAGNVKEIYQMTDACVKRYGRVDILVTCAGVQVRCPSLKLAEKDFDFVMDVNVKGVFFCCQAAGRYMRKQGGGKIILISSANCKTSNVGRAPYCISKSGVTAVAAVLGAEWAMYGIQVNSIAPGWTASAMALKGVELGVINEEQINSVIPMERWGKVEELANLALYLASEESSYIVGQTIFCDGGLTTGILPHALDYIKQNDDMEV